MFIFHRRIRSDSTDVFDICILENSFSDAESRFGPALTFFDSRTEDHYHEIGWVVLIENEVKKETEYFLACKKLSESEITTLWRELAMIVGRNCHMGGAEPEEGWFMSDSLR